MNQECVIWQTSLTSIEDNQYSQTFATGPYIKAIQSGELYEIYNPKAGGKYTVSYKKSFDQKKQAISQNIDHHFDFSVTGQDSFFFNQDLKPDIANKININDNQEKIRLSGYIAKENLKNNIPSLDSLLKNDNWLAKLPPIPNDPSEKVELLLKGLTKISPTFGKSISVDLNAISNGHANSTLFLYALAYCSDEQEFKFLIDSLKDSKDIKIEGDYVGGEQILQVTEKGWKRIKTAEQKTPNNQSNQVFIAMWLDPSMDELKQSIKTAIKNAGYKPLRIDEKPHSNKIDDEILSEIEKSRFIICDLTSSAEDKPRGSVYFEAGYALGKNIPIIWTCSKSQIEGLPFDIRQYNCLSWESDKWQEFEEKLKNRVENVIGKGPL